jgi:methylthioribulose-1-phosphate dehydratase
MAVRSLSRVRVCLPPSDPSSFLEKAYELRGAGAVLHSHALEALLATLLEPGAPAFRVSHLEMIKGLAGHGYGDELVIPIVENTPREHQLTASLRAAMAAHPAAPAVLVRRHGVYVWGATWQQAKTQAECLHYLFQCAVEARKLGMPPLLGPPGGAADVAAAALAALRVRDGSDAGAAARTGPQRHLVLELDDWSLLAAGGGAHDDVARACRRAHGVLASQLVRQQAAQLRVHAHRRRLRAHVDARPVRTRHASAAHVHPRRAVVSGSGSAGALCAGGALGPLLWPVMAYGDLTRVECVLRGRDPGDYSAFCADD